MSGNTAIETHHITAVLLTDGRWHAVRAGSFRLETYQFDTGERVVLGAGMAGRGSELGAIWLGARACHQFACPLSSIVAVRYDPRFVPAERTPDGHAPEHRADHNAVPFGSET